MNRFGIPNNYTYLPLYIFMNGSYTGEEYEEYYDMLEADLKFAEDVYGRSVLHEAVSCLEVKEIKILLESEVNVNAVDNEGFSILHEVFKNSFVNMEMVDLILKNGAYPDSRDKEDKSPLAYISTCQLSIEDKSSATNLLIIRTIIAKFNSFKEQQLTEGDHILCLNFCREDTARHDQLAKIRDDCLAEMKELDSYGLHANLFEYNNTVDIKSVKNLNLKKILDGLSRGKYPYFQDLVISVIKLCDFDNILKKVPIFAFKSPCSADTRIVLHIDCVLKLALYMSRTDFINLIISFWVESVDTDDVILYNL